MTVNSFKSNSGNQEDDFLPRHHTTAQVVPKSGATTLHKAASNRRVAHESPTLELVLPPPMQAVSSLTLQNSLRIENSKEEVDRQRKLRINRPQLQTETSNSCFDNHSRNRIDISSISTICLDQRNPLSVDTSIRHLSLLDTHRLQEEVRLARFSRCIGQVRANYSASQRCAPGSRKQQAVRGQNLLPYDRLHLRSQVAQQLRFQRA